MGTSPNSAELHLFCHETGVTGGSSVCDADLGCIQSILTSAALYVWPVDPKTTRYYPSNPSAKVLTHLPERYVTNATPGTPPNSNIKRVKVVGNGPGSAGVHVSEQS